MDVAGCAAAVAVALPLALLLWQPLEPTASIFFGEASGDAIAGIIKSRESLRQPSYRPPLWGCSTWLNLAVFMVKASFAARSGFPMKRDLCPLDDGGTVSIDWAADEATLALPPDAPVLVLLHTIGGCGKQCAGFMRYAASRGWRSCVLNRRGHDLPLTSARFNVMGSSRDTAAQMELVSQRWPDARLVGMAGISAGSGLLINYLGSEGAGCRVHVAASLCPAYSLDTAFEDLHTCFPLVDGSILESVKELFLKDIPTLLEAEEAAGIDVAERRRALERCRAAGSLHEFLCLSYPFAAKERGQKGDELRSLEEYMSLHNPMVWANSISVPTLALNAEDDMVCRAKNIPMEFATTTHNCALLLTKYGSHIAYQEGLFDSGSYLYRITLDFFEAALEQRRRGQGAAAA